MANNDPADYQLRYNKFNKAIEAAEGLNWYTVSLTNLDGITQLTGDVTAGPGSGSQVANISAGVITNAMINASASIALSKLAPLTPNRVLMSDSSGFVAASSVTTTTLGFLDATSSIQTQLNSKQSTLTIGNLTDAGTDGIAITGGTGSVIGTGTAISQQAASPILNGYLTSANFTIFNNKQPAGNYITALTGDVSATGPNSATATLATVNSNVGTFTNTTLTVNGKGLITAASNGTAPVTSVSGTAADISSTGGTTPVIDLINTAVTPATYTNATITVDQKGRITSASNGAAAGITQLTGDVTAGPGSGSQAATLATVNGAPGTTTISTITTNGKGLVTANSSAGTVGTGNVVLATSPTLITPTIGSATATSLNFGQTTLSTYQEGTFTPALNFGGATTGITYSLQTGRYTRIGRMVEYEIRITLTSKGSATGTATITGLPFAAGARAYASVFFISLSATINNLMSEIDTSTCFLTSLAAGTVVGVSDTNFTNTSTVEFTGTYSV